MLGLRNRRRQETGRAGSLLYAAAVAAAREPSLYAKLGVPDTLDGRFDLVALHTFLLVHRLREQTDLAQAVFDAMFVDMDNNLREIGVGDLSVGKQVRAMWEAFHGRSKTYEAALAANDPDALAAALTRNVWRGNAPVGAPTALASRIMALAAYLDRQPLSAFTSGQTRFPVP